MEHKRKIFGALAAVAGLGLHLAGVPIIHEITSYPGDAAILGFIAPAALLLIPDGLKYVAHEWQNYKAERKINNDITSLATTVENIPTTGAEQLNSFLALTQSTMASVSKDGSDSHVEIAHRLNLLGNSIVSRMPPELNNPAKNAVDTSIDLLCDKLGVCFRDDVRSLKHKFNDLGLPATELAF